MTRYDDKIIGTMLLTVIGIAMTAFITSSIVAFPGTLSPTEQQLTTFSPTAPTLAIRAPGVTAGVHCPVQISQDILASDQSLPAFPPGAPPAPEPPSPVLAQESQSSGPIVSFIMLDSSRRLAIINGHIVREGERVLNGLVTRIETNRVLFKEGKGEQWLHLN